MKEEVTQIQIKKTTRQKLRNLGEKGQTYDEIIDKLIEKNIVFSYNKPIKNKVLVIGASGLLGSKLIEYGKSKYQVFGTYNTNPIKGGNFFQLNKMNKTDVLSLIIKIKPDFVIDTSALSKVDYCETHQDETRNINVIGTTNIAEACKYIGAKMVFISTDYVFDGKKKGKYTEENETNPLSFYAKSKLDAEKIVMQIWPNSIIARTAVIYGNGGMGKLNFVLWLINELKNNREVSIITDQYNNPTLVDNLVEMIYTLCEKDLTGIFHTTGSECINRYNFSVKIAEIFGLNKKLIKPIKTTELNQVAIRPKRVDMSAEKIEKVSKVKALNVEEGLMIMKRQMGSEKW